MSQKKTSARGGSRKINAKIRRKLAGLFVAVVLALICLLIRITYINATSSDQYTRQVLSQSQASYTSSTLPFKRGDILDTNGTVLATSEKKYNVILDCRVVNTNEKYVDPTVESLVQVFGLSEEGLRTKLTAEETRRSQYQVVARNISIEQKNAYETYRNETRINEKTGQSELVHSPIRGVWFEETYVRSYPYGSLACDLIGFTYDGITADWGIEGYYNNTLNGVDGRKFGYWSSGYGADLQQTIIEPQDGETVMLTIDANIQRIAESYLTKLDEIYAGGPYSATRGAKNAAVLIMRPSDGAVLAMASSDPYDLNNPRDPSPFFSPEEIAAMSASDGAMTAAMQSIWRNYCISDVYEPGSVYKPITMAGALENGTLTGYENFLCDGYEIVSGTRIKCSENDGHGAETVEDVIANSCNDGMMQIGTRLGVDEFCKYQRLFGFGSRTGIDLSGEASGILYTTDTMSAVDLATSSFGQGFECTMVQEAAAICSIANGGYYYRPHVASKILDSTGATRKVFDPVLVSQTVSADNAERLRSYMKASVDHGTSQYAKVNGYSMGGKTGTAQKIPRADGKYLVSFIGFAPYDDPQLVIYVVVDEPNVTEQADNRFAQWIARDILREVLPYMNIYPDEELLPENEYMLSDLDNPSQTLVSADTQADTNVPEVQGIIDPTETAGGNKLETDGYTNEEAGLGE